MFVLLWFAGAESAFSQVVSGSISGTVMDQTQAVIPGAEVSLASRATGQTVTKTTSNSGTFVFPGLTPGNYDLKISMDGFKTKVVEGIKVDVGKIYEITETLEIGQIEETVTVDAGGAELIARGSAEVTSTITPRQMDELPLDGRDPMQLMTLNAGFAQQSGVWKVVNGNRATFTSVTLDGVNIQNNLYRQTWATSLSYLRPKVEQVSEFTMVSAAQGSESGFGSNQVNMVTPSGSNDFHGSVYWFHRNDALAANSFFNNKDGIGKNKLIRNQYGVRVSGPIMRDKLLFFGNYEGERLRTQGSRNAVVLTPDMRQGIFTYTDDEGGIRKLDILDAAGVTMDPYMSGLLDEVPTEINNFRVGDSTADQLKNTGGYSFNKNTPADIDTFKIRLDYILSDRHSFQGIYQAVKDSVHYGWGGYLSFKEKSPRLYSGDGFRKFFSTAWQWTIGHNFLNEVRFGAFLQPVYYDSGETFPEGFKIGFTAPESPDPPFTNPVIIVDPYGYQDNVWTFSDNASWQKGAHSVRFGFQSNMIRLKEKTVWNWTPLYILGISPAQTIGLTGSDFPGGISGAELDTANNLMATLAGLLKEGRHDFTIHDPNNPVFESVPGEDRWEYDTFALYFRDNWKLIPRLTLNLGLRWEYSPNVRESKGRISQIIPRQGQSMSEALLDPDAMYDFVEGDLTRKDLNNFAPSAGFAWDVFGNSGTVLRGGYSISYVNDEAIASITDAVNWFGVYQTSTLGMLTGTISEGLPAIPTPEFEMPLSLATIAADPARRFFKSAWGVDPDLVIPYVHSWQFGIQQRVGADTAIEIRYVGTKGSKLKRSINLNQVEIFENGFLDDFLRARSNGFLAEEQGLGFDPNYNPDIAGSQPLTVYTQLRYGGLLSNSTVRDYIRRGEAGQNAFFYQFANLTEGFPFAENPNANFSAMAVNSGSSIYHALQLEVRRRFSDGLSFNANYTFSKVLTNGFGYSFPYALWAQYHEGFTDLNNPDYDRGRAPFDLTHAFKANFIYELPFGRGRRFGFDSSILDQILGGWDITSIFIWQSGDPFSINSGRGTLNLSQIAYFPIRASSTLDNNEIRNLFGITEDPGGNIYFIDPLVINPADGRAVADDGQPPFDGQAFFHPEPGALGNLPLNGFNGPAYFNWDFSAIKKFRITEQVSLDFRAEFFNFPNHTNFANPVADLDATNFGQVIATRGNPRITQFGLKLNW